MDRKLCSHLLVVAHPDDEAIFFGGLLQTRSDWHVICVTDGDAFGKGKKRAQEFKNSCKSFKVKKFEMLKGFPDLVNKRFNVDLLIAELEKRGKFKKVFTHGILGDYGHPHHIDVSYATHKVFGKTTPVYSPAFNIFPDFKVALTPNQFKIKADVLWRIYKRETRLLFHTLPCQSVESFKKLDLKEVESIYRWIKADAYLNRRVVKSHKWLIPFLESRPVDFFHPEYT